MSENQAGHVLTQSSFETFDRIHPDERGSAIWLNDAGNRALRHLHRHGACRDLGPSDLFGVSPVSPSEGTRNAARARNAFLLGPSDPAHQRADDTLISGERAAIRRRSGLQSVCDACLVADRRWCRRIRNLPAEPPGWSW